MITFIYANSVNNDVRIAYTFPLWARITILVNHPVLPSQRIDPLVITGTQSILSDWLYKLTDEEKHDFQSLAYAIFARAENQLQQMQSDIIGNPDTPKETASSINVESISAKLVGPNGTDIEMYLTVSEYKMFKALTAKPQAQPQTPQAPQIAQPPPQPQTNKVITPSPHTSSDNKRKI